MSLTQLEKHHHLLLKYIIISISNAILHKYSTKHTQGMISDLSGLRGCATCYRDYLHERKEGKVMMIITKIKNYENF